MPFDKETKYIVLMYGTLGYKDLENLFEMVIVYMSL